MSQMKLLQFYKENLSFYAQQVLTESILFWEQSCEEKKTQSVTTTKTPAAFALICLWCHLFPLSHLWLADCHSICSVSWLVLFSSRWRLVCESWLVVLTTRVMSMLYMAVVWGSVLRGDNDNHVIIKTGGGVDSGTRKMKGGFEKLLYRELKFFEYIKTTLLVFIWKCQLPKNSL